MHITRERAKSIQNSKLDFGSVQPNQVKWSILEKKILDDYTYYSCMDAKMYPKRLDLKL